MLDYQLQDLAEFLLGVYGLAHLEQALELFYAPSHRGVEVLDDGRVDHGGRLQGIEGRVYLLGDPVRIGRLLLGYLDFPVGIDEAEDERRIRTRQVQEIYLVAQTDMIAVFELVGLDGPGVHQGQMGALQIRQQQAVVVLVDLRVPTGHPGIREDQVTRGLPPDDHGKLLEFPLLLDGSILDEHQIGHLSSVASIVTL